MHWTQIKKTIKLCLISINLIKESAFEEQHEAASLNNFKMTRRSFLFFSSLCYDHPADKQRTHFKGQRLTMQTHTHTRAGSNSQAAKAVVDSNLDLAGLGYFYFPKSYREEERWGGVCIYVCVLGGGGSEILLQMSDNDRWPGAIGTHVYIHQHCTKKPPKVAPMKRLISLSSCQEWRDMGG